MISPRKHLDSRCGAFKSSCVINASESSFSLAVDVDVAATAEASWVAEDAIAALGSVLRELGVGSVAAGLQLNTDVGCVAGTSSVIRAADVAGKAVGISSALGAGGSSESQGHGDDG